MFIELANSRMAVCALLSQTLSCPHHHLGMVYILYKGLPRMNHKLSVFKRLIMAVHVWYWLDGAVKDSLYSGLLVCLMPTICQDSCGGHL